jgi:hypothetical protein
MRDKRMWGGIALAIAALLSLSTAPATALMPPVNAHGTGATTARQVAMARSATKDFTHPPAAKKAGYALLKDVNGVACIAMKGMGGMGVHYANGTLVDGKIQVRHPEALVYRFTTNGHLKLSALEYLVTRKAWRVHHPSGRPELFGHRFNFTPAGNRFGLPAFFSLHAWVWDKNPAGRFAPFNPDVHCPTGV